MKRGKMNEVQSTESDVGRCNHKWLVLGSTLNQTHLVGWMRYLKDWSNLAGEVATHNALNAYDHRSQFRNRKPLTLFGRVLWFGKPKAKP